ncbi:hypothetical protein EDD85DRAFT_915594 [Armillaria nabsnona]|nr:hypothetical protein EDD85DRAFT_915594 [Armillaria nabsnona]
MMDQRAHILYTTHLIRKGHGYPFWYPGPDCSRPADYTERGVQPGDVGILNNTGGFDHLFNIFRDADDPVNRDHVPPSFQPLLSQNTESLQITRACYHYNITSANVDCTEISAGASANVTGLVQAEASFEFSTTKESAAILCLPNSATKYEMLNKRAIKEYAIANGADWYTYVNSRDYLAREASNGTIYLVTGCDKTDSWGLAAVGKPSHSRSVRLSFIAAGMIGGEVRAAHTWSTNFSADTRVHPLPSIQYSYPVDHENQCIFARGFTISLSDSLFKSDGKTILRNISGSLKDKMPSFDKKVPCPPSRSPEEPASSGRRLYLGSWISPDIVGTPPTMDRQDDLGLGSSEDRLSDKGSDLEISISEFPPRDNELRNPSAVMNSYLLEKDPSLYIAVTHDEEWMEITKEFGIDEDTTDAILWARIKDELDKRSFQPTTDSMTLGKVRATADQAQVLDNYFQLLQKFPTGSMSSSSSSTAVEGTKKQSRSATPEQPKLDIERSPDPDMNRIRELLSRSYQGGTAGLNKYLMGKNRLHSVSWVESSSGPLNKPMWTMTCKIDGEARGTSTGPQKHVAKDVAANQALAYLMGD